MEGEGRAEAKTGVIVRVTIDDDGTVAEARSFLNGMAEQRTADPLLLAVWQDAQRPEGENLRFLPARGKDLRLRIDDMPHEHSICLGNEIKFRDNIR